MFDIEIEEGPLWNTIKRQLYRSEVSHIKRLVGEPLIQQNKMMWDEVASLRQIFTDFQEQNERRSEGLKHQSQLCGSQHRDLLRRQAQMLIEDIRQQALSSGHALEDLLPEAENPGLREYCLRREIRRCSRGDETSSSYPAQPATPSTRPSTSSGVSSCGTPEPGHGLPQGLPLGRPLGLDELGNVADSIRDALEGEHESLMEAIGEEMRRFEAEDARRVDATGRGPEPSTAQLQHYVHKLQDILVSPSLRTLCLTGGDLGAARPTEIDQSTEAPCREAAACGAGAEDMQPMPIVGGASVRRLKALISQRRRSGSASQGSQSGYPPCGALGVLPETSPAEGPISRVATSSGLSASTSGLSAQGGLKAPAFDPFWDDPFA